MRESRLDSGRPMASIVQILPEKCRNSPSQPDPPAHQDGACRGALLGLRLQSTPTTNPALQVRSKDRPLSTLVHESLRSSALRRPFGQERAATNIASHSLPHYVLVVGVFAPTRSRFGASPAPLPRRL
jgi:hypothetical protein